MLEWAFSVGGNHSPGVTTHQKPILCWSSFKENIYQALIHII
jgi:hypothetical protein